MVIFLWVLIFSIYSVYAGVQTCKAYCDGKRKRAMILAFIWTVTYVCYLLSFLAL